MAFHLLPFRGGGGGGTTKHPERYTFCWASGNPFWHKILPLGASWGYKYFALFAVFTVALGRFSCISKHSALDFEGFPDGPSIILEASGSYFSVLVLFLNMCLCRAELLNVKKPFFPFFWHAAWKSPTPNDHRTLRRFSLWERILLSRGS